MPSIVVNVTHQVFRVAQDGVASVVGMVQQLLPQIVAHRFLEAPCRVSAAHDEIDAYRRHVADDSAAALRKEIKIEDLKFQLTKKHNHFR